jgi:hypothetical protein
MVLVVVISVNLPSLVEGELLVQRMKIPRRRENTRLIAHERALICVTARTSSRMPPAREVLVLKLVTVSNASGSMSAMTE